MVKRPDILRADEEESVPSIYKTDLVDKQRRFETNYNTHRQDIVKKVEVVQSNLTPVNEMTNVRHVERVVVNEPVKNVIVNRTSP